jgi:hypothetical protein
MAFDVSIADVVIACIKHCDRLTISDQNRILFGLAEELMLVNHGSFISFAMRKDMFLE